MGRERGSVPFGSVNQREHFAWRDVKVRYKQAALGAAWAVLQPLLTMVLFTLFFGRLARIPSDGVPYPLFSYSALLLWTYFAAVLGQGGQSLVANSNLITKVYFPRLALPASVALSGLLDFVIGVGFLIVLMAYYRISPGWPLLLAPVFVAGLVLFTLGASLFLASLSVRYRDIKYAADAAQALKPLAGQYAYILFAVGLFNASLFAASILPLSRSNSRRFTARGAL